MALRERNVFKVENMLLEWPGLSFCVGKIPVHKQPMTEKSSDHIETNNQNAQHERSWRPIKTASIAVGVAACHLFLMHILKKSTT